MLPIFGSLIQQASSTTVHISVFYTRASRASIDFKVDLPPNIDLAPGRPAISSIINSVIDKTCALSFPGSLGLVVGVCGPAGLGRDVRNAAGIVDSVRRTDVGGIELCEG
jgi:ferric-chelate reductase